MKFLPVQDEYDQADDHEGDDLWREIYSAIAHGIATSNADADDIRQATENVYNYIRGGCKCKPENTTGETQFMVCNICGLPTE